METFPQDAVARVQMSSYDKNSPFYEVDLKDLHPFGKLHIKLIRTYPRECEATTGKPNVLLYIMKNTTRPNALSLLRLVFLIEGEAPAPEEGGSEEPKPEEPEEPSRYQNNLENGR